MPNTLLTSRQIAATAVGLLRRDLVLPTTVRRDVDRNFATNGVGRSVDVRMPASIGPARTYTDANRTAGTPITVDSVTENMTSVPIDTHLYKALAVTDEELTLDLVSFATQILAPQVSVVSEAAENRIAQELNSITSTLTIKSDGTDVHRQIIAARKVLNDRFVPIAGRYLVVSSDVEALLLNDPDRRLVTFDGAGSDAQQALREATVGRLYGFTVLVSAALTAGTAIAYHPDAFAFVLRAPIVPDGVPFGQSVSDKGIALRWIKDYDSAFLRDRSIVSTFAGAKVLDANRAVKMTIGA